MSLDPPESPPHANMLLDLPGTRRTSVAAIRGIAAALLLLAVTSVAAADFDAGMRAYNRGDYASAFREFRALAEQGHASAQNNLGYMYDNGEGVPEDDRQAVFWYRKAAEQGNAEAQNNLGAMHATGEGVPEDDRQAVFWYRRAAEQGNAIAQNNLGVMYDNGEGVPEDDRQAVFWYRKAAEQGNTGAQNNLGAMYYNGEGVPEDDRQAVFWYRKAAEQGNADAQFNLGLMYYNGEGVPEDDVRAYAWFNLAAAQGDEDAERFRAELRQVMAPAQVAEGQALSRRLAARIESGAARETEPLEPQSSGSGFVVGGGGDVVTTEINTCYQYCTSAE